MRMPIKVYGPLKLSLGGVGEWLDQFGTARHYVGLNFGSHPLEYKVLYELSRKLYNP